MRAAGARAFADERDGGGGDSPSGNGTVTVTGGTVTARSESAPALGGGGENNEGRSAGASDITLRDMIIYAGVSSSGSLLDTYQGQPEAYLTSKPNGSFHFSKPGLDSTLRSILIGTGGQRYGTDLNTIGVFYSTQLDNAVADDDLALAERQGVVGKGGLILVGAEIRSENTNQWVIDKVGFTVSNQTVKDVTGKNASDNTYQILHIDGTTSTAENLGGNVSFLGGSVAVVSQGTIHGNSPFLLVAMPKPAPAGGAADAGAGAEAPPQTGDQATPALWLALAGLALCGLCGALALRRRRAAKG